MGIENTPPPPTGGLGGPESSPPMTLFDFLKDTFAAGNLTLSKPNSATTLDQGGYSLVLTDNRGSSLTFEMTPLTQFPQLSLPDYARIPNDETGTLNPWLRAAYLPNLLSILAAVAAAMAKMKLGDGLNNAALTVQEFNLSVELGEEKRNQYQLEAQKLITEAVSQILSGVVSMGMGIFSLSQQPKMMAERSFNNDLKLAKDNPNFKQTDFGKLNQAESRLDLAKTKLAAEQNKSPAAADKFFQAQDNLNAKKATLETKQRELSEAIITRDRLQDQLGQLSPGPSPTRTDLEAKLQLAEGKVITARNDVNIAKEDVRIATNQYDDAFNSFGQVKDGPDPEKLRALKKEVDAAQGEVDKLLTPGPGAKQIQDRIEARTKEIESEFNAPGVYSGTDRQGALANKIANDPELGRLKQLQTNNGQYIENMNKNKADIINQKTTMFNQAFTAMNEAFQATAKGVANLIQASITMDIANVAYNQSVTEGAIKVIDSTKQVLTESIKNFGEIISSLIQAMLKAETDTTASFKFQ